MLPKNIIVTVVSNDHIRKYQKYIEAFWEFNPEFELMLFTNDEQDAFVKTHYPEYYTMFRRLPEFIQRSDFFRLAAIHYYGGIYCDIDIKCVKPFDPLLSHTLFYPVEEEISIPRFWREKQKGRYHGIDEPSAESFLRYANYAFGGSQGHWFFRQQMDNIANDIDWIVNTRKLATNETYEYYVYNTSATDRTTRAIYNHQPSDLTTLNYPGQKITDEDTLLFPLYFGEYAEHRCHGVWKINRDR